MREYVGVALVWITFLVVGVVWGELMVPFILEAIGMPLTKPAWWTGLIIVTSVIFASVVAMRYNR